VLETKKRSVAKALSWRFVATFITATVVYAMTGDFTIAAEIGLLDTVVKFGMYFAHERVWLRVSYGRISRRERDYQI
jgi:uncharacterized membrane protein